ncbi:putative holliday junction resolvase, partial [Escherichia coli O55:H7 str. USDA 5905]
MTDAHRFGFTLPADGEHLLATPWQHIFCIKSRGALSPGSGAYCSPAATEIKPVRTAGIKIIAEPPDKRRRDLDNILKAPLDALTHAGVLMDDEQFDEINIVRGQPVSGGRLGVKIY